MVNQELKTENTIFIKSKILSYWAKENKIINVFNTMHHLNIEHDTYKDLDLDLFESDILIKIDKLKYDLRKSLNIIFMRHLCKLIPLVFIKSESIDEKRFSFYDITSIIRKYCSYPIKEKDIKKIMYSLDYKYTTDHDSPYVCYYNISPISVDNVFELFGLYQSSFYKKNK